MMSLIKFILLRTCVCSSSHRSFTKDTGENDYFFVQYVVLYILYVYVAKGAYRLLKEFVQALEVALGVAHFDVTM